MAHRREIKVFQKEELSKNVEIHKISEFVKYSQPKAKLNWNCKMTKEYVSEITVLGTCNGYKGILSESILCTRDFGIVVSVPVV